MGNFNKKILLSSVLNCIVILYLCACINPININEFLDNPVIQDVIERQMEAVGIIDHTGDNLKNGNQRISGLSDNKYYLVEIKDESNTSQGFRFVTQTGQLSANLSEISKVTGGVITNLNNDFTYEIWTTSPLNGNLNIYDTDAASPSGTPKTEAVSGGALTLPSPEKANYFIDFTGVLTTETKCNINFESNLILKLKGEGTETDYIFFDGVKFESFKLLNVVINKLLTVDFNVSVSFSGDKSPIISHTPSSPPYNQESGVIQFNVTNPGDYDNISWYLDGVQKNTGNSFNFDLSISNPQNNKVGVYLIVVIGKKGNVYYSTTIEIEISGI